MMEKLGRKRLLMPFAALLVAGLAMTLVVYPMMNAKPKDLPLGVLSLDKGVETPQGTMNAGDLIAERIVDGDAAMGAPEGTTLDGDAASWTRYGSQAELDAALADHELYAAVVIPQGYTAAQAQAQLAAAQASASQVAQLDTVQVGAAQTTQAPQLAADQAEPIRVVVDEGKNPMAAASVESAIKAMAEQAGLDARIERLNAPSLGGGSLAMFVQFTVLPTFILSVACSVSLFVATRAKRGTARSRRLQTAGVQLALAALLSCCVGFAVAGLVGGIAGLDIPVARTGLFLWLASFCLMAFFVGCLDVAVPLGALAILACFACGLATGNLPYEFLPAFWQDWLYPWVPQRWMADGVRGLYYLNGGAWNASCPTLVVYGIAGLAALAAASLAPRRNEGKRGEARASVEPAWGGALS